MINLPQNIKDQGDKPQWSGEINSEKIAIYYDDDISGVSHTNKYALFSERGFHGWLSLGFTMYDVQFALKYPPTIYEDAYNNHKA